MKSWFKKLTKTFTNNKEVKAVEKNTKAQEAETVIKTSTIKKHKVKRIVGVELKKEKTTSPVPLQKDVPVKTEEEKTTSPVPLQKDVPVEPTEKEVNKKEKNNWFSKLGINFRNTSSNLKKALLSTKLNKDTLNTLEEALLTSDLGVENTYALLDELKDIKIQDNTIKNTISNYFLKQFNEVEHSLKLEKKNTPQVILVFGVNGSGKTTSIAKIASKAKQDLLNVKIVAADTFRAAAVEQLCFWGEKIDVEVIKGNDKEDPASVVYKAHKRSIEENIDLLIIDTAGRLHNKIELMEELKKIMRVIEKNDPTAPHEKILILDSTIGQNTYTQIEAFKNLIGINGIIMTKLDSSAKGGSLIGITKKYKLPIYAIGVGENIDDLIPFNPKEFIDTLLGQNFGEKNESIH